MLVFVLQTHFTSTECTVSQEWACQALQIQILFVTGNEAPTPGTIATTMIPSKQAGEKRVQIWLWSCGLVDGAGKTAEHFVYLCQDQGPQKRTNTHKHPC